MNDNKRLQYDVDEKPPFLLAFFLGLQHVILIISGVLITPIIVSRALKLGIEHTTYLIFAAIVVSAITTLFQALRVGFIGSGYLLFLGPATEFVPIFIQAVNLGGLGLAASLTILAAPIEMILAFLLKYLRKIITPVVGGIVIMLVAFSLTNLSLDLLKNYGEGDFNKNLFMAFITFATTFVLSFQNNKKLRLWAPILGILGGLVLAGFLHELTFTNFQNSEIFGIPKFKLPGFKFSFSGAALALFISFLITTIISAIETTGDAMAIQEVSKRSFKKIDYNAIKGALNNDAFGNILSGVMGIVPNTTYSQNIPVVQITGVASKLVGVFASVILFSFAFFPKLSAVFLDIPNPIFGATMLFFSIMLFYGGLKLVAQSGRIDYESGFTVSFSLLTGIIAEFTTISDSFQNPFLIKFLENGISVGGFCAILISIYFYLKPRKKLSYQFKLNRLSPLLIQSQSNEIAGRYNLNKENNLRLNLIFEEIYALIKDKTGEKDKFLKIKTSYDNSFVDMEFITNVDIKFLDIQKKKSHNYQDQQDIDNLGIFLIEEIADELNHQKISGEHFISIKIDLSN